MSHPGDLVLLGTGASGHIDWCDGQRRVKRDVGLVEQGLASGEVAVFEPLGGTLRAVLGLLYLALGATPAASVTFHIAIDCSSLQASWREIGHRWKLVHQRPRAGLHHRDLGGGLKALVNAYLLLMDIPVTSALE